MVHVFKGLTHHNAFQSLDTLLKRPMFLSLSFLLCVDPFDLCKLMFSEAQIPPSHDHYTKLAPKTAIHQEKSRMNHKPFKWFLFIWAVTETKANLILWDLSQVFQPVPTIMWSFRSLEGLKEVSFCISQNKDTLR